ncbi:hypothetical protein B0T25DRAFT_558267 [Lasiosphaeria hispida]|uniref:Secreted protein n=1 Tax=Lasiosphaeria hispida TaxID=260671 RepID=A0AAJ0H6R0_9PEZI|nr:hypothetical protein B0T25DRAFT_558267 [Lasiosphaeria hispida]
MTCSVSWFGLGLATHIHGCCCGSLDYRVGGGLRVLYFCWRSHPRTVHKVKTKPAVKIFGLRWERGLGLFYSSSVLKCAQGYFCNFRNTILMESRATFL